MSTGSRRNSWEDPSGSKTAAIMAPMQRNLQAALLNRANGLVSDFFTSGKIRVEIMGAAGETLEFSESARTIAEQMCARWGVPPFMFGFSWASTERMSTAQAKAVTEIIDNLREMFEPGIRELIDLRQAVSGGSGKYSLKWNPVSLQDEQDSARSDWMRAQADAIKLETSQELGRMGIYSMPEIAQQFRPDLEGLTPVEVLERLNGENGLPKLEEEVAPAPQVQVAQMRQGPAGSNPMDEQNKQWWRDEWKALMGTGNGNGNH